MDDESVILSRALEVIYDRQAIHGQPEDSFEDIGNFWSDYLEVELTGIDVAIMMILLKIARMKEGEVDVDNLVDIAGYSENAGRILEDLESL